jgi:hypothetical protein
MLLGEGGEGGGGQVLGLSGRPTRHARHFGQAHPRIGTSSRSDLGQAHVRGEECEVVLGRSTALVILDRHMSRRGGGGLVLGLSGAPVTLAQAHPERLWTGTSRHRHIPPPAHPATIPPSRGHGTCRRRIPRTALSCPRLGPRGDPGGDARPVSRAHGLERPNAQTPESEKGGWLGARGTRNFRCGFFLTLWGTRG